MGQPLYGLGMQHFMKRYGPASMFGMAICLIVFSLLTAYHPIHCEINNK